MDKLYYCLNCKRIFSSEDMCTYCQSENIKELTKKSPVNVIGTKQKGRVFKIRQDVVKLLVIDVNKNKLIKTFQVDKIKKLL